MNTYTTGANQHVRTIAESTPTCGLDGTEPFLRPDEKVCEVTGLTYLAGLSRSPHVDESGKAL